MAEVWLNGNSPGFPALDVVILGAGLRIVYPRQAGYDWRRRSRTGNTRGFPQPGPYGVVVHHTASSGASFPRDVDFCGFGHKDAPVGNMVLGPDGSVGLLAAGSANTQGKGGPLRTSVGYVPQDQGNGFLIAIEASNSGMGEAWPPAMQAAYLKLVAALCAAYRLNPLTDVFSHFEWCLPSTPGRKCDPAGPAKWAPLPVGGCDTRNLWRMDAFRQDVLATMKPPTTPQEPAPGPNPTTMEVDKVTYRLNATEEPGTIWLTDGLTKRWEDNGTALAALITDQRVVTLPKAQVDEIPNVGPVPAGWTDHRPQPGKVEVVVPKLRLSLEGTADVDAA